MRGFTKKDMEALRASGAFDAKWYLETYPDVKALGMDPLEHYLWIGKRLGRKVSLYTHDWGAFNYQDREPSSCAYFSPSTRVDAFDAWQAFNAANRRRREKVRAICSRQSVCAVPFSVVVPVFDPPLDVLEDAIRSVLDQSYGNFELVLVDDCSTNQSVRKLILNFARKDARIKPVFREQNGHISEATNTGVSHSSGEFIVFLDNDDMLDADALAIFSAYIERHPDTDIAYSDDAKLRDGAQKLHSPKFKPDWSPELLLSYCYISHLKIVRKALYDEIGGSRRGFEGSQDHDMLLRASEKARHIGHIPQILYKRRALPGSTAASGNAKPYSFEAGRKAVEEAFRRRGVPCEVEHPNWAREAGVGIFTPQMPDSGPSVAVIIPTRNNWKILDRLLISLGKTKYKNFSVLIVDNESDDIDTINYYNTVSRHKIECIKNPEGRFNYAYINNKAVQMTDAEYLLFLNDDTEVISPNWLSQMMGWARLSGVGAVGARLLFPNGTVQHAGVAIGLRNGLTAFRGLDGDKPGYLWYARVTRNVAAVTAACMLTPKRLFSEIGGFDEQAFAVAYNDVDYCLRLQQLGYRVVFCGEAELYHHEGYTRSKGDDPREIANLKSRYRAFVDRYYSPHLGIDDNRYGIKPTVVPIGNDTQPVRVLAITHNLNHEGAPNSAFELISGLQKRGRISFTVISPQDGPLRENYNAAGIPVEILPRPRPLEGVPDEGIYSSRIAEFRKATSIWEYDVVYANTATTFWAIDAAYGANIPSVWNIRESESWKEYYSHLPTSIARKALQCFGFPYRTVFVADSTRRRWSGVDRLGNFETIHNGLNLERIMPNSLQARSEARRELKLQEQDICLLSVGTTAPRKGQHELLEAVARLPEALRKRIQVYIVGLRANAYGAALEHFAQKLVANEGARIHLISETGNTAQFWQAADLFVFTSRLESYPRVLLEAMAYNLPIISTPTYGAREQLREGLNAAFYSPGDIQTLTDLISRLVANTSLRMQMASKSADVLASLESYEGMLDRYESIFVSAANSSVPELSRESMG